MASYSEVKAGLDAVAVTIRDARTALLKCKSEASVISGNLSALPTTYSDVVTTVQAYGTTNAAEALAKADLAKLTAEFQALKTISDGIAAIAP
jgi:hypothetical protein